MGTRSTPSSRFHIQWLYYLFLLFASLPLITSCENKRNIVNNLDEREANEILVFLASKGIEAIKQQSVAAGVGGGNRAILWDIIVDNVQSNEAMALLNQNGLPRRRSQNLLEIFSNVGLVPSEMEQQIRYQAGLAEQIGSTIRKIDGILDSEVKISFPKEDLLNPASKKGKITASVYIKHNGVLDDPNSHLITRIKRLVAASITGLDYDNVTVVPDRARFNELPPGALSPNLADMQYMNVWGLVIAKDSLTRFRILFFTFLLLILGLITALAWFGWKLWPIIRDHIDIKDLFYLHPIEIDKAEHEEEASAAAAEKDEKKIGKDEDIGLVDKDIEEEK